VGDTVAGWDSYGDSEHASDEMPGVQVSSHDPALIYFTSGTTSKPKMVVHTHSSYPVGHLSTLSWLGLQPGDVHLAISSPGWGKHAWSCFFAPWIAEATVFVYNYARFDARALVAQLDRAHVTTFCAPPTVWRMLIQNDITERPGALREILSAGEPLNPEVISRIRAWWGLVIRDGYGQTETTAIIANPPGSALVPGSMGTPLPGVTIALIDPLTGEPGDEGEICIDLRAAPVNLMSGYLGDEAKTASAMADGYFHTGDVASRDERGYITFIGRTDDIFKSSDYKVSPFEVESLLLEHEAVAEAAVIGAPDDIRLNVTKAYVALAEGWAPDAATARELLRHAAETMPPYMRVRRVEFSELPKTASGKIRRVELREREVELAARGERPPLEWREGDDKNTR
jgi:acetyl-CoA synthetase